MNNAPALADPAIDPYVLAVGVVRLDRARSAQADDKVPALLAVAEARRDAQRRPGRPGRPHPGPARPELVHRPEPPRGPARRRLLPRQRHLGVGRDRVGGGRAGPPEAPERDPGPGQEVPDDHALSTSTARPRRSAAASCSSRRPCSADLPSCDPDVAVRDRDRQPGPVARHRPPHATTASTLTGEQDIFGQPFDSAAMAALEASEQELVGWHLERQLAGPAAAGPAARGAATSWSGSSWSGSSLVRHQLVRQQLVGQLVVRQLAGRGSSWSGSSWSGDSWSTAGWD